ncbi:tetratricopeptide repeat protein [Actinomadura meridiana]|uniref:Tetratricopeptide repeat protein n=1 Tax=Actinomadura meridiana TaxID=559626 RepID=A0ABP8CRQ7_9ACTN
MSGNDEHGSGNRFDGEARNVVQAQHIEVMHVHGGSGPPEPPSAFPLAANRFHDRRTMLERITEVVTSRDGSGPALFVVAGLRGVGKTAMAVHWGSTQRDRFPDGLLYADLGGGLSRRGMGGGLGEAVTSLLEQLGVSGDHLSYSDQGRLALLRSRLARRKVLLLLDDARLSGEVERLLPTSPHSVVFVTTDGGLTEVGDFAGRHDAEVLVLGGLPEADGLALLRTLAGDETVDRDPDGALRLVRACGGWPLAIRMAAGRVKVRRRGLGELAAGLEAARRVPRPGPAEEGIVQMVGDAAYGDLPDDLRRAYRLLALHPGGDRPTVVPGGPTSTVEFGSGAAAALLDRPAPETDHLLDSLVDRHLLDADSGRYAFHGLVRAHARGHAEPEGDTAVRRVAEWYLRMAAEADLAINPYRPTTGPVFRELRGRPSPYGEGRDAVQRALGRLRLEHRNLAAVVHAAGDRGWHDLAWQVCEALWGFYFSLKHYDQWIDTHRIGLRAAQELDDPGARFRMGIQLGRALYETKRFEEAHEVLAGALHAATAPLDRATALEFIGRAHLDAGEPERALEYFLQARDLETRHDRPRGVAINLHHLGRAHLALNTLDEARDCLERAQRLFAEIPDPYNQARVLTTLGRLHLTAGDPGAAMPVLETALEIMRTQHRTYQVAEITESLSEVAALTGDPDRSETLRQAAIMAYDEVGSLRADELRDASA